MEITEKLLVSLGGWSVMKEARALRDAGSVREATYEPPVLRGRVVSGGKEMPAGLRLKNPVDIENLCPCRDSRVRGIICAHSVAVGLQFLAPHVPKTKSRQPPLPLPAQKKPPSHPAFACQSRAR